MSYLVTVQVSFGMLLKMPVENWFLLTLCVKSSTSTDRFTHKKLQHDHYSRGEFIAEIQMYHHDCFVFIHGSGCSSKITFANLAML